MFTKFFNYLGAYSTKEKAVIVAKLIVVLAVSYAAIELLRLILWWAYSMGIKM